MAQTFFVNSSTVGVDLNNQSTTQLFALGTHLLGNQDTEWVYVQANTSIVGQSMVAFNSSFTCAMASGLDVVNGLPLGTAQTSVSSQAFGWITIRGANLTVLMTGTGSVPQAVFLGSSAITTGILVFGAGTGSCTLQGVQLQVTASSSATSGVCLVALTWPKAATVGSGG
jgi:hypothetical protein